MGHPRSWLLGNGGSRGPFKSFVSFSLIALLTLILSQGSNAQKSNSTENGDDDDGKCEDGLVLPVWLPQEDLSTGKENEAFYLKIGNIPGK